MTTDRRKHLQRLARKKAAYEAKKRGGQATDMPIIAMTRSAVRAASAHQQQVFIHGDILAFTTSAGDAWLLERVERWCMRLLIQGRDPIVGGAIHETPDQLMVEWSAKFRLADNTFCYDPMEIDDDDPPATFPGYPIAAIQAWIDA